MKHRLMSLIICATLGALFYAAQVNATGQNKEQATARGRKLFLTYCASCHGVDGSGNGRVAVSLNQPPSDLRRILARHGKFPAEEVRKKIAGDLTLPVHGQRDMPVWGEIYKRSWAQGQNGTLPYLASKELVESIVRVRILALIDYIFTLQEGRR